MRYCPHDSYLKKVFVVDMNNFLIHRISTLTAEEMDLIFHGQFPSELTQKELERKEALYCSRLSEELDRDCVKTYSHSEAWK